MTDQERQGIFKDGFANLQRDLDELSNGIYFRAAKDPSMRLRARLDELLKRHYQTVCKRFQWY